MENRERILQCALDLFYLKGYDAVGIQEICQAAGITKPTLYHYFGSKYGMLETLFREGFDDLFCALDAALQTAGGVEQTLYNFLSVLMDYTGRKYKAYLFLMSLYYSPRENETYQVVKPYIQRLHDQVVGVFERASQELGNMNGRQEQFAIGFLGLINHYILFYGYPMPEGDAFVSEEKKRALLHQFMHGIYS